MTELMNREPVAETMKINPMHSSMTEPKHETCTHEPQCEPGPHGLQRAALWAAKEAE
eukprot:CAMPEP_0168465484 /NCGR_PEP_ID=MMETSP0228-20121227/56140_1 /TAXON_ID=133427 /ORGANISM="Protoceratium reticulatum, Strain CCCM 535 (=CCMP 1889)" /LENGTH=56 /DNA_ID=CAMNT_0008481063 /DNA_START=13 /DNA_END=180 /DNA_ORIENTATION=+